MIATIGLSLLLKDSTRLLQGARTRYMLIEELNSWRIVSGLGFDVYLNKGHVMVAAAATVIGGLLWWINQRSRFGRCQRACAQDLNMAALIGVRVDRTIMLTVMLGSAIVGAAGMFAAGQYGVINFHMGTLMGFKALTAALLGGIGSLPGAVIGGMIIALTEVYTAALCWCCCSGRPGCSAQSPRRRPGSAHECQHGHHRNVLWLARLVAAALIQMHN
jgi:branched-chain amino acid transport system permease protein